MPAILDARNTKTMERSKATSQQLDATERARSALFFLDPDCGHDVWVRAAMAAKAAGLLFDDFHCWSSQGRKYKGERDCASVWKSIKQQGGVTERTLFFMAQEQGWHEPSGCLSSPSSGITPFHEAENRKEAPARATLNGSAKACDANPVWQAGEPATESHPYIIKKQGLADELRVYPASAPPLVIGGESMAGWLMVPCTDTDGSLRTIQFISPTGAKRNLPNATFGEGFFALGNIEPVDRVFLVEGIGQAWAVRRATDDPVVVFFGAARMGTVARVLRQRLPSARLVLLPDRGKEAMAAETARCVAGEWCELPADVKSNYDLNDLLLESGPNAVQTLLESSRKPALRFPLISAADLRNAPPMEWLVHSVLPRHGMAAMYGPSGSGKSFLALDLAAALSAGKEKWFDHPIKQCAVTYVCLEGAHGLAKRVAAWQKHNGTLPASLGFTTASVNMLSKDDVNGLAEAMEASNRRNGLVIVDTLNRAAPAADENSSADMGRIIAAASQLQAMVGGMVMLIHHSGKNASQGMRGHSSLHAAMDAIIAVGRTGRQPYWRLVKCKDGNDSYQFLFQLKEVLIGKDEQELDVTSCVVVAGGAGTTVMPPKAPAVKRPAGSNQKVAKEVMDYLLEQSGEAGKGGAPEGTPCLRHYDAVDAVAKRLTCDPKHRKERAKEAIDALIDQGLYCSRGEWLWGS